MSKVTFKGSDIAVHGSFLHEGDLAPDFSLVDADLENITLSSYRDRKKVIVTVPSLDTGVCAKEAKMINQLATSFPSVQFLVISQDLPFAQQRFCKDENLHNIRPLSNMRPKSHFGQNYGLLMTDGPLSGLLARSVIYLNENDQVIYSELVPEITQEPNYDLLREKLESTVN